MISCSVLARESSLGYLFQCPIPNTNHNAGCGRFSPCQQLSYSDGLKLFKLDGWLHTYIIWLDVVELRQLLCSQVGQLLTYLRHPIFFAVCKQEKGENGSMQYAILLRLFTKGAGICLVVAFEDIFERSIENRVGISFGFMQKCQEVI